MDYGGEKTLPSEEEKNEEKEQEVVVTSGLF